MNALAHRVAEPNAPPLVDRRTRLVVNADDFGLSIPVSDGILDACSAGRVTAVGVFANVPAVRSRLDALLAMSRVTPGVHLNLTLGTPLTGTLRYHFRRHGGRFPSKLGLFARLAGGRLPIGAVADEWRAQIRCLVRLGLRPWFLNSHEHVHAWPALTALADELAREFSIPWVRRVEPEWRNPLAGAAIVRNVALALVTAGGARTSAGRPHAPLLGLPVSGHLDARYVERRLRDLELDRSYELMCHPGREWPEAPARLLRYHAWAEERAFLLGTQFERQLVANRVRLVSYADLDRECSP